MAKKKTLRYAFIGAGGIAGAHMRYLKDMEDVEMVAMADISKPGMEAKAQQFGIDGIYTDYHKMLAEVKPDAVSARQMVRTPRPPSLPVLRVPTCWWRSPWR